MPFITRRRHEDGGTREDHSSEMMRQKQRKPKIKEKRYKMEKVFFFCEIIPRGDKTIEKKKLNLI